MAWAIRPDETADQGDSGLAAVNLNLPDEWKSFIRDNLYVGAATAVTQITGLLFSALFARRSAEEYGTFQYFLAIVGLLSVLGVPGMKQALQLEMAKGIYPIAQFVRLRLRYSAVTTLLAIVAGVVILFVGRGAVVPALLLAAPLLPFYYALPLSGAALESELRFDLLSQLRVIRLVIINLALATLVIVRGSGMTISLTYVALHIAADGMLYWYVRRQYPAAVLDDNELRSAVKYARSLSVIGAIGVLRQHMDRFVVGTFLSASTLSVYAIAAGIPQRFQLFSRMVGQTVFPRLASLSEARSWRAVQRQFPRWAALTMALCLAAAVIARPFILILYGETYVSAIGITYVLIGIMGIAMLSMPLATLFESKGRADALYRTTAISSLMEIGILLGTVPLLGLSGVLWARGVAKGYQFAGLSYLFIRFKRRLAEAEEP